MAKERIETGREPVVEIAEVGGDLVVRPWMNLDIEASGDFTAENKGDVVLFTAVGDLMLKVPEKSVLSVGSVQGDVVIKSVGGQIQLGEVFGDAVLSNTGLSSIALVQGDLVARNVSGALLVEAAQGDVVIRNVDGDVTLGTIHGDLVTHFVNGACTVADAMGDVNLAAVNGDISIAHGRRDLNIRDAGGLCQATDITGDIRLRGGLRKGDHQLSAQGDIILRWPANLPLAVDVQASEIRNNLPLEDVVEDEAGFHGHLGLGGAHLSLMAAGKVVLKEAQLIKEKWGVDQGPMFDMDFMAELSNLGERISSEVTDKVSKMASEMETNFAPKMEKWGEQFAEKMTYAAGAARVMAEDLAEKERARTATAQSSPGATKTKPDKESATNVDEQLRILKMVEKGVITPEEANLLLEALEGN